MVTARPTKKSTTVVKSTVVRKAPAKKVVKKVSVALVGKETAAVKTVVKAQPAAKAIEKSAAPRSLSKAGVRPVKKIQTAEGWKRSVKKQTAKKR